MIKNRSEILEALREAAGSEPKAVAFLEGQRWGAEPTCPLCESREVYQMMGRNGERNKDYRWRCRGCKKMFTVRTGTPLEETRLPLRVWVYALWRACASKKGISALQLSREREITRKSALFVLRRIRHGMGEDEQPKLTGTVEVDELYVGGKPRFKNTSKRGRGTSKTPVVGIVQREGDVRFRMMERVTAENISNFVAENADLSCRIITDEFQSYKTLGQQFLGGHESVNHSAGEYVRLGTDIHSNTVEGVFSLIRRGVMGTFHSVSRKHLPNYLNEFEFRWNTRKMNDGERVAEAIKKIEGKRLEYRESVDNPPYLLSEKSVA
ncbi:MAG TPA: IS1595 family transposase [Terriglobia bacterium]|nr:IS1595 family transposase [Terriglobia bacterium]